MRKTMVRGGRELGKVTGARGGLWTVVGSALRLSQ